MLCLSYIIYENISLFLSKRNVSKLIVNNNNNIRLTVLTYIEFNFLFEQI